MQKSLPKFNFERKNEVFELKNGSKSEIERFELHCQTRYRRSAGNVSLNSRLAGLEHSDERVAQNDEYKIWLH